MNLLKTVKYLTAVFIVMCIVVSGIVYYFEQGVHKAINLNAPMLFQIKSGQSSKQVLNTLKSKGILAENIGLKIRLKLQPHLANIKVGTYQLLPSMTGLELLALFASGKEAQFSISLVEGLRWQEWVAVIQANPRLINQENLALEVETFLDNLPYQSLEGLLLPDTYHFTDQTTAMQLVERAYRQMTDYLQQAWLNRSLDLPYTTPYEALIMASIIEKETGVAEERSRIAGVFVNRLKRNMRLQTDPTVIYGMGSSFDGNIRRKDLKNATPYNTYVIKGLPPTPIAMPSKLAIDAALHPLETEELYFVSKGDGSHQFSVTLQQHNLAVRKYQLKK
ncbi:endolytic transglycosylase MltG [Paraglaciecola aquimarina]|uniref:Endolytic murein transglycosylase n=1 Tax=Paraglaciecola aquimarina TaxID=1235557 RepID=A0ABU3SZC2_9ALTE|nr:endolytic transglycosylase MltG [Paraglaciecola aquimarina]MDU0355307.1 endolytic transglycosylase MltG [Paraglaciecola aquimarina]